MLKSTVKTQELHGLKNADAPTRSWTLQCAVHHLNPSLNNRFLQDHHEHHKQNSPHITLLYMSHFLTLFLLSLTKH